MQSMGLKDFAPKLSDGIECCRNAVGDLRDGIDVVWHHERELQAAQNTATHPLG